MLKPSQRSRKRARTTEIFREFAWRIAGALTPPSESAAKRPRRARTARRKS
jgi:hypothetical protein